jgi:hypothetical protein
MFIGHYAVGLAAKKWAPKASLGTLVAAAIWLDLVWPVFLLLDLEHFRILPPVTPRQMAPFDFYDYPLSHSLVMTLAWAALWGLVYLLMGKNDSRGAWMVGGLVVSHWVLDFLVHRHDLPLLPAETGWNIHKYGLGLWDHPPVAILLELALFAAGFWLYLKSTKARDSVGQIGLWAFGAVLVALYAGEVFGPPPSNPNLVSLMGVSQLLFVAWAYWVDDHRKMTGK